MSDDIWNLIEISDYFKAAIGEFFGMNLGNLNNGVLIQSSEALEKALEHAFGFPLPSLLFCPPLPRVMTSLQSEMNLDARLAFNQKYLGKETIASSFVKRIVGLTLTDEADYFASYILLVQSSGMGKSRLISENWMDGDHALFIFRINCKRLGDCNGYPLTDPETDMLLSFM